jgi:enoyl-CoA hydratase/carnithine racemase
MSDLVCEKQNQVAIIKLNRPDRMNAISAEMLTALGASLGIR